MERLVFNESTIITHMTSHEGEVIEFVEHVDPKEYSVEIWCKSVETSMVQTMQDVINKSIQSYKEMDRKSWVKSN